MRTDEFDYPLPPDLIAQVPTTRRDDSRLLVLDRASARVAHHRFHDLPAFLRPGDVLVMNDSRVLPARLRGVKPGTGGQVEVLLVEEVAVNDWWVMLRPGKRVRPGSTIHFKTTDGIPSPIHAIVLEKNHEGHCRLQFSGTTDITTALETLGETPLPPYITRPAGSTSPTDRERYQTIYAQAPGSVAAPTAGLHFTPELLAAVHALGAHMCFVTLHVGLGTFAPVKAERLDAHVMHEERFTLSAATAETINAAKREGRRVIAVGTTSVRVLESAAQLPTPNSHLSPQQGRTRIFIRPPHDFRIVDAFVTNFHLPQSTLLMLASAFAAPRETRGRELMLATYAEAVRERYRFFSYGDAMLIV